MIAQRYKDMLSGKSVIRQISEWSTARGTEIGYENVFDYSLGNPSVPCPEHFTKTCIDLLQTKEPVTLHGYSPTLTIPAVRKAVAESLNRRFGMDYGMEHIFMATGAAGALAHAMRCVAVPGQDIITFAPFFYPLDGVAHWNRLYGRQGFFQYQFVVPLAERAALDEIFATIARSGQGSFLAVLKTFGRRASPGLLSFPMPGMTLALDFPNGGARTRALFDRLDAIVAAAGGRLYAAKDARMSAAFFQNSYPGLDDFEPFIDPKFSSDFARRVLA